MARLSTPYVLPLFPLAVLSAQDKKPDPPRPTPTRVVARAPVIPSPLAIDSLKVLVGFGSGGASRSSPDGRYVAMVQLRALAYLRSQSPATVILRGTMTARLYRGTPPATTPAGVRPVSRTPPVADIVENMSRYADMPAWWRGPIFGSLDTGESYMFGGNLRNGFDPEAPEGGPYDAHSHVPWQPSRIVIAEVGAPYTVRVDIAHEADGRTRYYRADLTFRFDANGRVVGPRLSYPPPPPPTASDRPTVEVRR